MMSAQEMKRAVADLYESHPLPWRRCGSYVLDANGEHVLGSSTGRKFICQAPGMLFQLLGEIEILKEQVEQARYG
jgi:hypothetical protein